MSDFGDIRSWVLQSDGTSWGWLDVISGTTSPNNAKLVNLPAGVWSVSGMWAGEVEAELRYQEAGGTPVIAGVIPAVQAEQPRFFAMQLPLTKNTSIHIRPRGSATTGARATLVATYLPIYEA